MKGEDIRQVAVIGAGTIGASWTAAFLSRGLHVKVYDPSPGAPDLVRRTIAAAWPVLQRLGATPDASPENWSFHTDPVEAVQGAQFVQENAPERYEVKHSTYSQCIPAHFLNSQPAVPMSFPDFPSIHWPQIPVSPFWIVVPRLFPEGRRQEQSKPC